MLHYYICVQILGTDLWACIWSRVLLACIWKSHIVTILFSDIGFAYLNFYSMNFNIRTVFAQWVSARWMEQSSKKINLPFNTLLTFNCIQMQFAYWNQTNDTIADFNPHTYIRGNRVLHLSSSIYDSSTALNNGTNFY